MIDLNLMGQAARTASRQLAVLLAIVDALEAQAGIVLAANAQDIDAGRARGSAKRCSSGSRGRTGGVDQPGTAHAVPSLSAAQRALLIRSWRNADRPAVHLAVAELIRATKQRRIEGPAVAGAVLSYTERLPVRA
jgi:hypothetical protein